MPYAYFFTEEWYAIWVARKFLGWFQAQISKKRKQKQFSTEILYFSYGVKKNLQYSNQMNASRNRELC